MIAKPEKLYTVWEVSDYLSVSRVSIYRMIRDRKLLAVKLGASQKNQWRVRESDLQRYLGAMITIEGKKE